jgi:hypothetical protein
LKPVGQGLIANQTPTQAFLRAVDAAEADTFSVVVVEDFEDIAVEDADAWTIFRHLSKLEQHDIRQLDRNSVS